MSRPISSESVFRAVAHPTRRRILELLRRGERPAGDLIAALVQTSPNVSRHLQVLRSTGLVAFRRRRTSLIYRINASALRPLRAWANEFE